MKDFSSSSILNDRKRQQELSGRSRRRALKVWVALLALVLIPLTGIIFVVLDIAVGTGWEDWQRFKSTMNAELEDPRGFERKGADPLISELNFAECRWMKGVYESNSIESPVDRSILYLGNPEFTSQFKIGENHWTNLGPAVAEIARKKLNSDDWSEAMRNSYDQLILKWSSEWESVFSELSRESYNRPYSTLVNFSSFPQDWNPDWSRLERFYRGLQLRNLACLRAEQSQEPIENFSILHRTMEAVASVSWTGQSFSNTAIQSIRPVLWEGLALGSWEAQSLKELQRFLHGIQPIEQYRNTLTNQLFAVIDMVEHWEERSSNSSLLETGPAINDWYNESFGFGFWVNVFNLSPHFQGRNLVTYVEAVLKWHNIDALLEFDPDSNEPAWRVLKVQQERQMDHSRSGEAWLLKSLGGVRNPALAWQSSSYTHIVIRIMETAVALERFRLLNGSYPVRLESLEELELISLPTDLGQSASFIYSRQGPGKYKLHSRGLNLVDDSGEGDDVVWEGYPEKQQELAGRLLNH